MVAVSKNKKGISFSKVLMRNKSAPDDPAPLLSIQPNRAVIHGAFLNHLHLPRDEGLPVTRNSSHFVKCKCLIHIAVLLGDFISDKYAVIPQLRDDVL